MADKEHYFYTTFHPYGWSSGPTMYFLNSDYELFVTLEDAKKMAEKYAVTSDGMDLCETTYGTVYSLPKEEVSTGSGTDEELVVHAYSAGRQMCIETDGQRPARRSEALKDHQVNCKDCLERLY